MESLNSAENRSIKLSTSKSDHPFGKFADYFISYVITQSLLRLYLVGIQGFRILIQEERFILVKISLSS